MVIIAEVTEKNETKVLQDVTKSKENNIENNAMTSSSSGYSSNRVPLPQLNMMNNNTNMGKMIGSNTLGQNFVSSPIGYLLATSI